MRSLSKIVECKIRHWVFEEERRLDRGLKMLLSDAVKSPRQQVSVPFSAGPKAA